MPIYEYRCSSCGHELEVLQKFSEAPLAVCPACSETALVKLMSAAGFQLKGTGWYATDFKGSGGKPAQKNDDGAGKGTEAESKSDSTANAKDTKSDAKDTKSDAKDKKSDAKVEAKAESNASKSDSKTEKTKAPASTASSTTGS